MILLEGLQKDSKRNVYVSVCIHYFIISPSFYITKGLHVLNHSFIFNKCFVLDLECILGKTGTRNGIHPGCGTLLDTMHTHTRTTTILVMTFQ